MGESFDCFKLVKKMSVEEKQAFKKDATLMKQSSPPLYLILFEVMEGTLESEVYSKKDGKYDESAIKKRIDDPRLLKHFSVYKNTLYEHLLSFLRKHNIADKVSVKLAALSEDIQLLLERGMNNAAYKRLKQAKALAKKYHYIYQLLDFLNIERRLVRRFERRRQGKLLEEINRESNHCILIIRYRNQLLNLYDRFHTHLINEYLSEVELQEVKLTVARIEEQIDTASTISFHLNGDLHTLKFNLYYAEKKYDLALEQQKLMAGLYKKEPHMVADNPDRYVGFLHNYMNLLFRVKSFVEIPDLLSEMRKIIIPKAKDGYGIKSYQIQSRVFQLSYYNELILLLNNEKYAEAIGLIEPIDKGLKHYHQLIPVTFQLMFFQNIAMAYFLNQEYPPVLDWVNRILTLEDSHKLKMNTRLLSRLLQIVVHYELEDYGIVAEHLVPSFRKYLSRYKHHPEIKKHGPTYRKLISVLSRASYATKDKKRQLFARFYEDAKAIPIFAMILPWVKRHSEK